MSHDAHRDMADGGSLLPQVSWSLRPPRESTAANVFFIGRFNVGTKQLCHYNSEVLDLEENNARRSSTRLLLSALGHGH